MNLSALEAKVTSDEGKQELNRLKMALNEAELLKQKFSGAPAAIDFAAYKGKVDASLLALVEPRPFRPPPRHRRVSTPSSPRRVSSSTHRRRRDHTKQVWGDAAALYDQKIYL